MSVVNFSMAWRALWTNPLRSALTILGIVIGIASVISLLSIGKSAQKNITDAISSMGSRILMIRPGVAGPGLVKSGSAKNFTEIDVTKLRRKLANSVQVSPVVILRDQAKFADKNTNTTIMGIDPTYLSIRNYQVDSGRFFDRDDISGVTRRCILGKTVADALFPDGDSPVGLTIRIGRSAFVVIGTYQSKGNAGFSDEDDRIFVPLTTAQKRLTGATDYDVLYASVGPTDDIGIAENQITDIIRSAHQLRPEQDNDFIIRSSQELLDTTTGITQSFTLLLGSIALISLIVGGIGIMNILLVSVTERTREIGIRKAIGAYDHDILTQFLIESLTLCVIGGILGIVLGIAIAATVSTITHWPLIVPLNGIFLAVGVSVLTGLFFGYYPAHKAAKLHPVDALRYE